MEEVKTPPAYYLQRNGTEEGPFTIAQINRMRQSGLIEADTPCRSSEEQTPRRLDVVFPHLKDYKADPEKIARIKKDVSDYEIKSLIAAAFGGGMFFWAPLGGGIASLTAVGCGLVLLVKHRKPIGLLPLALGVLGIAMHYSRRAV